MISTDTRRIMYHIVEDVKTGREGVRFSYNTPLTPYELTQEITSEIGKHLNLLTSRIVVLFTVEFAIALREMGCENVTLVTDAYCMPSERICNRIGVAYKQLEEVLTDGKKFGVVLGNPPYKNGKETGGKSSLWRSMVARGWELTEDDGTMVMVTPQFSNSSKDLGKIFTSHQTNWVRTDIARHFPGVGSSFTAWSVTRAPKTSPTHFIDEGVWIDVTADPLPRDLRSLSIIDKVMKNRTLFQCLSSPEYYHTSVADGKNDEHLFSRKTPNHPYALRRTSGEKFRMWGRVEPSYYRDAKVSMTFSGYPHYQFHDETDPIGTIKYQSGHILVKDRSQGENLISLYQSLLYRYIQDQLATGGMRGRTVYEQPSMDLDRHWSDEDLFSYFGLTNDEVKLIRDYFKTEK